MQPHENERKNAQKASIKTTFSIDEILEMIFAKKKQQKNIKKIEQESANIKIPKYN